MKFFRIVIPFLLAVILFVPEGISSNDPPNGNSGSSLKALGTSGHVFRKNAGQWDNDIYYRSVTSHSSVTFFSNKVSFGLEKLEEDFWQSAGNDAFHAPKAQYLVWEMEFVNANNVAPVGSVSTDRNIRFFGPGSDKSARISEYKQLKYSNLYNGVDLVMYSSEGGQLKYDVLVQPGGDIASFAMKYNGVEGLEVNVSGELVVKTSWGVFNEAKPYSYQWIDGRKVEVDVAYKVNGTTFGYEINGQWDPEKELIIDPIYLDWSTFFYGDKDSNGTWGWTWILDVDIDNEESVYAVGMTSERFPYKPGAYDTTFTFYTGFVAKMNASGDSMLWFTYIGSSGWEYVTSVTVNELKQPVISGITSKNDFPTTSGAFDEVGKNCGSGYCYQSFVTKFDSTGSSLIFSTFLTGTNGSSTWNIDWIRGMAINGSGEVYVCGNTASSDYPVTAGAFQTNFGGEGTTVPGQDWSVRGDAFLTKLKSDGSGLVFSTFIGGAGNEAAYDIFLNGNQDVYIVGTTNSNNFPTTPAAPMFNKVAKGPGDGFVSKFKPDGSGVIYSVMVGGSGYERFEGIYSNGFDEPYVAGYSGSSDFPVTTNAYQKTNKGGDDVVIFKMPSSGTNMIYSTYVGGSLNESSWNSPFFSNVKVTANVREEAILTCVTKSKNFPITPDALQSTHKSQSSWAVNSAIVKLSYGGDKLLYGTYFGGSGWEYPGAVKTKRVGCVSFILTGGVTGSADYPTTNGAWKVDPKQWSSGFTYSGYLTKFRDTLHTDLIELALLDTIIECDLVFEVLDAQNQGADIWWSHGPRTRMAIIKDTGTYWVTATYGCDTVSDTIHFDLEYRPIVPVFGNDTTYCDSFPGVLLDAKNDTILASYLWMDSSVNQTYTATEPGLYSVTITTPHCGSKSDQIELKRLNTPDFELADSVFCDSVSITVDVGNENNQVKYLWFDGDTLQAHSFNDTGTYYVVLSNLCGVDSVPFVFDKITTPVAGLPGDSVFCDNINWLLRQGKSDNQENYYWSTPDQLVSFGVSDTLLVSASGGYRVEISNKCGSSADTVYTSLIKTPVADLVDTVYNCDQVVTVLQTGQVNNQETYLWSNNETTPQIIAANPGWYKVTISNKCGLARDSVLVVYKSTPLIQLPSDSVFCDVVNLLLDAEIADDEATYEWSTGATTSSIMVNDEGIYEVTVYNRCGQFTDQVEIGKLLTPTLDLGADQIFCGMVESRNFTIGMLGNNEVYLWSNGATSSSQTLNEGRHWAQISNKCATVSDTVVLRASPYPVVDLGPDTILCGNFALNLDAGNPGMQYEWLPTGETTQKITARKQIIYTVTVTNEDGCSSTDQFEIGTSCISTFHIPSAFSPNRDGINDTFKPNLVNFENYTLLIFNRWGEIIFQTENVEEGWDGTFGGEMVMDGIYFYSIRFITTEDGAFKTLNGPVHVLR